jgi:hypothetical protein
MSYLVLLGLIVLIGFMNLMMGLLQWLVSPIGLASIFILGNLSFCAFKASCPPVSFMRRLCARAGCSLG